MEREIEDLKQKVLHLERLVSKDEDKPLSYTGSRGISIVPEPTVRDKPDFDQVEGWKLIEFGALSSALEKAQTSCNHRQLVLLEVDRKKQRAGLAAMIGFVCKQCGQQTLLPTSPYSRQCKDYTVNTEFQSALGKTSYEDLVALVQTDKTIKKIGIPTKGIQTNLLTQFTNQYNEEEVMMEGAVVKEEVIDNLDDDEEESYLEPAISLVEPEEAMTTIPQDMYEAMTTGSPLPDTLLDLSTVTTNTPSLALSTVQPGTLVMGGSVTPHPPHQIITVHPNMFIRTTCSKVFLPPGIYKYHRNNGLQSIMSVRADKGTFDTIESHYHITGAHASRSRNKSSETKVSDTKPKDEDTDKKDLAGTKSKRSSLTPMNIFANELRASLGRNAESMPSLGRNAYAMDFEALVIQRWTQLTYEEKKVYTDKATQNAYVDLTPPPAKGKKTKKVVSGTTNIPLPALKRYAATVVTGLKEKSPDLAALENRGKLNKIILKKWMNLSQVEKDSFLDPPTQVDETVFNTINQEYDMEHKGAKQKNKDESIKEEPGSSKRIRIRKKMD